MFEICWETPGDRGDVLEFLGSAFPEPPEFFADIMSKDPWYHYCQRRLLKVEGQIVSNVDLFTRKIWIGGSPVLLGDLGNVSTHPDHRRKGYCSAVVNDLVAYMEDKGYGFSTIYAGAPEFYEGLKWRLFPEKRAMIELKGDTKATRKCEVRQVESAEHLSDTTRLYDRCSMRKTGATIRSGAYWRKHFDWLTNPPNCFVVVQNGEEMLGCGRYAIAGEVATVKEVGYVEDASSSSEVFVQIIKHIHSRGLTNINMGYFTPEHPIASTGGENIELGLYENTTLRMRLINVKSLFSCMLPQLREKLKTIQTTQYENCITIGCEVGGAALHIRQDELDILDAESGTAGLFLRQRDLIRLILGQTSIRNIEFEGSETLSEEDIGVLDALFPKHTPLCWQGDHF